MVRCSVLTGIFALIGFFAFIGVFALIGVLALTGVFALTWLLALAEDFEIVGAAFYSVFAGVLAGVFVKKTDLTGDEGFASTCFFSGDFFSSRD